nr:transcription factor Adf-1-like [Drosophila bipectinata]
MEGQLTKQKNSRPEKFSAREDKLKLISAVKTKPIIWDLTHKGHFNAIGLNIAWEAVAAELQKDVKDCKASWKSLRASMRYHQKISKEKKQVEVLEGMLFPVRRRMTTMIETSMSSETCEDTDLMFAEYLDDSLPSISFDQSTLEDQELQLQKGLEDMEKESSSSYSYKPSTKKRKAAADETCALTQKITEYVDLQVSSMVSQTKKIPLVATYWGELMNDLPEEMQDQAEQHITKFLLDLKQKAKYH